MCVYTRYVILNVFNIYTYAFNVCVCVSCVYPPPSAYTRGNRHLYYFYDLYTLTPSLAYKIYIILYVIFPDDYFIQLETIVFINIPAFVLDKQNRVITRREMTRRFLLVRYYNIIINRIPWPLYSIHTAESLGAVNYILLGTTLYYDILY